MSNTDSDTLITISSSSDSGGDVSKDLTQAESSTPHKEIEALLPELPNDWKPPVQPIAQFFFNKLCLFTVDKPDLEEFWQEVRQEDNWYNCVMRVHDLKSRNIPVVSTINPYSLLRFHSICVYHAHAMAVIKPADLTSKANYIALSYLSKPLLLVAPLRQMYFVLLLHNEKKLQQIMTRQPGKMVVLTYLTLFRMMYFSFPLACASLALAFSFYSVYRGESGELLDVYCGGLHASPVLGRRFQEERAGDDLERCAGCRNVVWNRLGSLPAQL
ncbi:hypothetical protein DEU56DRAFT_908360 [Suillus clintonianus]|uniref:uncharacterized protein n=1 Tax=Suillus clintonianus TaxID=1904413 RepID=UPI001B8773F8|nr:uncharacterized protein DEU56DRAFT_908360 [Suillus clintonianus]KAG2151519.1 hypothetical protein DEU56DRAFT_908360 [Suillus clintonianus]